VKNVKTPVYSKECLDTYERKKARSHPGKSPKDCNKNSCWRAGFIVSALGF
jgi:hypothetical protein